MRISRGTIIRSICLLLALGNLVLEAFGKSPLHFEDETVTEAVSIIAAAAASIAAWWKNNSFTRAAIEADRLLNTDNGSEGGER